MHFHLTTTNSTTGMALFFMNIIFFLANKTGGFLVKTSFTGNPKVPNVAHLIRQLSFSKMPVIQFRNRIILLKQ